MLRISDLRSPHAGPFDLAVPPGGCAAITGPSGAGKSLFLRMIADLDPNQGEVSLDGADRDALAAPAWRRRVIYSAAEPAWWADGVADHLAERGPAAADLAARLGLDPAVLDGPVARLSTGERQRLALIRALLHRPRALLLDEPTAALDEAATARMEALLRARLADGLILVLVTHRADQAARLGTLHRRVVDRRFAAP